MNQKLSSLLLSVLAVCSAVVISGCVTADVVEFFKPGGDPNERLIRGVYETVVIKESTSAEVLDTIYMPEYELLSQSKSVIACQGKRKREHEFWFNMVGFDEEDLEAKRKYLLIVDEKPKKLFVEPWPGMWFDCEVVIDQKTLNEPYTSENEKRIAILERSLEYFREDIAEVEADNKTVKIGSMMVNQAFETVLLKLKESPSLAQLLDRPEGIKFNHINLDKGKVYMIAKDDIAIIKMILGMPAKVKKRCPDPNEHIDQQEPNALDPECEKYLSEEYLK